MERLVVAVERVSVFVERVVVTVGRFTDAVERPSAAVLLVCAAAVRLCPLGPATASLRGAVLTLLISRALVRPALRRSNERSGCVTA